MTSVNEPSAVPPLDRQTDFEFEVVTIDAEGKEKIRTPKRARSFCEDLGDGIMLEMVAIPAGEFWMGTADVDRDIITQEAIRNGREQQDAKTWTSWEMPQHRVQVPKFWMGKFAVTQAQWSQVAALPKITEASCSLYADPANFKGAKRPVEKILGPGQLSFAIDFLAKQVDHTVYPVKPNGNMPVALELRLPSILEKLLLPIWQTTTAAILTVMLLKVSLDRRPRR